MITRIGNLTRAVKSGGCQTIEQSSLCNLQLLKLINRTIPSMQDRDKNNHENEKGMMTHIFMQIGES